MATINLKNLGGLNLKLNPLLQKEGDLIRAINVDSYLVGAKKKRPGYVTYLTAIDTSQVNSLFNWTQNDGTTFWNYRYSGGTLYYSTQGTGAWTICGGGTLTANGRIGHAVLENTLIIGDGTAATRHTTNGTSFTNTTSAPIASGFEEYQGRIWAIGTASNAFYSTVGTATDWTTDSSSILIPGPGKLNSIFKSNDRLNFGKNSNTMFRYDGFNLIDLSTNLSPSSPYSVAEVEGYRFGLNRLGVYGYGGGRPEIVSNAIEKQIYNDSGEGIPGANFDTAPGVTHRYDYFLAVGTITDDLTDETIDNAILKYNFQLDEWHNYKFANFPTAWCSYQDASGVKQLIFGDASGQCYTFGGTATNDNGSTIESIMEMVIHSGTLLEKEWKWIRLLFNPGCESHIQVATTNTFVKGSKNWVDLGDARTGVVEYHFPQGSRSRLLFLKITEASRNTRFDWYGGEIDGDILPSK